MVVTAYFICAQYFWDFAVYEGNSILYNALHVFC